MKYSPATMDVFGDWGQSLGANWIQNAIFGATSIQTSAARRVIPVLSLGLADPSGFRGETASVAMFNAIAAGTYDYVWTGIVNAYKDAGFCTLYLRIGYEQNGGTYFPWFATRDAPTAAAYVAAFRRVALIARAVPGTRVMSVWSPAEVNWTGYPTAATYPGDDAVDVVALDVTSSVWPTTTYDWGTHVYDQVADPKSGALVSDWRGWATSVVNREHFWDYPSANASAPTGGSGWGFEQGWQFAKTHNKPFAVAETGAGNGSTGAQGPFDDPAFPAWLQQRLQTVRAAGVKVAFVEIWARDAGGAFGSNVGFLNGQRPLEAAAWTRLAATLRHY